MSPESAGAESVKKSRFHLSTELSNLSASNALTRLMGYPDFLAGIELGKLVLRGGIGILGVSGLSREEDLEEGGDSRFEASAVVTSLELGALYYLAQPKGQTVTPFFCGSLLKSFAAVESDDLSEKDKELAGELGSIMGLTGGGGLEYWFNPYLSVGIEVGLRYVWTAGKADDQYELVEGSASLWNLVYSGVNLAFHLPL